MPYRICKTIEVENGHMLSKHPDKCQFPHGHSRKVEFTLEAEELNDCEMVCDFKIIKSVLGEWLDSFDHAMCMNTDDPAYEQFKSLYGDRVIGFTSMDPTTEVMAKHIFDFAEKSFKAYAEKKDVRYVLNNDVRLVSVRVWETSSSWAEWSIR